MKRNKNSNLPEELVNEILLRLSVKTLLVCKCVCKEWCALIKSPSFVNQHFSHDSNQDCLLFRSHSMAEFNGENYYAYAIYEDERHSQVEVSNHLTQMPTDDRACELMGPENGVFCVVSYHNRIGLLNPAIREFKTLPPHPLHGSIRVSFMVGFGLDPSSGDFKVVAFEQSLTLYGKLAFVYNLSSDSWKRIEAVEALELFDLGDYNSGNRILNGVNHWIMKAANSDISSILAFDMRNEMFQEISIPDALRNTEMHDLGITEYGDSIVVMSCKHEEGVDLWVMGRDGLWSKSFIIVPFQGCERLLCVWKKNMVFFESSSSPLKMCDISTQRVITLIPETDPKYVCDHFIFKESLVSIKGEKVDCVLDFYDPNMSMTCMNYL